MSGGMELRAMSCRHWQGARNDRGYGVIIRGKRRWKLHRWVWSLAYGAIPDGMCVLHHCDNPSCFRLDHLFLGTQADNVADMWKKGRARPTWGGVVGERHGKAKLSTADVRRVRAALAEGESQSSIARRHNVASGTINAIAVGRTWKGVD